MQQGCAKILVQLLLADLPLQLFDPPLLGARRCDGSGQQGSNADASIGGRPIGRSAFAPPER
jgi:hypothetical protein